MSNISYKKLRLDLKKMPVYTASACWMVKALWRPPHYTLLQWQTDILKVIDQVCGRWKQVWNSLNISLFSLVKVSTLCRLCSHFPQAFSPLLILVSGQIFQIGFGLMRTEGKDTMPDWSQLIVWPSYNWWISVRPENLVRCPAVWVLWQSALL